MNSDFPPTANAQPSKKAYSLYLCDETAQNRLEQMMPQLAKEAGATEELKASDPMKWVGQIGRAHV